MKSLNGLYQTANWKNEKHVPVIHLPESVQAGEEVELKVFIGEEIPHPNTHEHHIVWMKVYFQPEESKFPVEIGTYDFRAHGEFDLFTEPFVTTRFKTNKPGTILVASYCNIHGLWENSAELKVE